MNDERTSGARCVEDESEDRGRCDCAQLPASMKPCARCRYGTVYEGGFPTICKWCGEEYVRGGRIGLYRYSAPEQHDCQEGKP